MLQFRRSVPLVRRTETSVQFGVDEPVLLDGLTSGDLALLDSLCRGCGESDFLHLADRAGVRRTRAGSLLELLRAADVLEPRESGRRSGVPHAFAEAYAAAAGSSAAEVSAGITSTRVFIVGMASAVFEEVLTATGFEVERAESAAAAVRSGANKGLTVLTGFHTHDIAQASTLFADDAWHLSVRVGDRMGELVPVRPGAGPCAVCTVLASRDADAGWFDAWTQLSKRSARAMVDPLLVRGVCLEAARMLREFRVHGTGFRDTAVIDARDGTVARAPASFHPDCDCRIPLSPSGAPAPAEAVRVRTARV